MSPMHKQEAKIVVGGGLLIGLVAALADAAVAQYSATLAGPAHQSLALCRTVRR